MTEFESRAQLMQTGNIGAWRKDKEPGKAGDKMGRAAHTDSHGGDRLSACSEGVVPFTNRCKVAKARAFSAELLKHQLDLGGVYQLRCTIREKIASSSPLLLRLRKCY